MALPLIIGIIAAVAAAGGVGAGAVGGKKIKDAKDIVNSAERRNQAAKEAFEKSNDKANEMMDTLGKKELEIVSSFEKFADLWEQIQNKPEFKDIDTFNQTLPKYEANEMRTMSTAANVVLGSLGGAAAGTAGGFAAAGLTTSIVTAVGTASTGTAISTLSGAALHNAVLAALGGGAVKFGGGGMALGSAVLGGAAAGVGVLAFGLVLNVTGSKMKDKAWDAWNQMIDNEKLSRKLCNFLNELRKIAGRFHQSLCAVDLQYRLHLDFLEKLVNDGRLDYNEYTDEEKIKVKNSVLLVQLLYEMCKTKLVLLRKETNVVNRQVILNKIELSKEVLEKIC